MKRFFPFIVIAFLASCNAEETAKVDSLSKTEPGSKTADIVYPYEPSYSGKFEMGDPAHAKAILDMAKDWDNNNLDNSKQHFADSLTIIGADGNVMSGTLDSVMSATKSYRSGLGTVSTKVHAWAPIKSVDKNENWVLLWTTEYRTGADGKKDSTEYQETWRMNKDGKADMLMQYMRKNPPPQKM